VAVLEHQGKEMLVVVVQTMYSMRVAVAVAQGPLV
jgi:hypothetical protein